MGVASSTTTKSDGSSSTTTDTLHIASTVIFMVVTVLQAIQTIYLASNGSGRLSFNVDIDLPADCYHFYVFKDETSTSKMAKTCWE